METDDDEIERYAHDAPWEDLETGTGDTLPVIFGEPERQAELKILCEEYQDIISIMLALCDVRMCVRKWQFD
jgi:hypothetical protein